MTRLSVPKTYKVYIGGQFVRSESGRHYQFLNKKKQPIANICLCSRKDIKAAQTAARSAQPGWQGRTPVNRGQILYRMAEMLESRKSQFRELMLSEGASSSNAEKDADAAIDRLIYYAGWCDKYLQVFGNVNPVASPHFNFSFPEPLGVVSIIQDTPGLLAIVSAIAPVIAGGNVCIYLAPDGSPLTALSFAEVLVSSDVPPGLVNILSGDQKELVPQLSSHLDINAVIYDGKIKTTKKLIMENCSLNVKRFFDWTHDWSLSTSANPYLINEIQEIKTTWHPVETSGAGASGY